MALRWRMPKPAWMAACSSTWTTEETETLRGLWVGSLPPGPSNRYADDPRAAAFRHKLFFDTRFSSTGDVSCATCHQPELMFTDGLSLAEGVGTTDRKTITVIGAADSHWQFWDGRKDSQSSQALGPLENPVEHGGVRTLYVHLIAETAPYMHAGQFTSPEEVLIHYNHAPESPTGHTELKPLHLNRFGRDQIIAFLRTLNGGVNADSKWLQPP